MTQPLWRGPKTGFSPREGVTRPIHGRMEASAQYVLKCTNVMHFGLVREGMKLFKKKTKKELIDFALREIIRREKAKGVLALEGKIQWEGDLQEMRKGRFADLG